MIRAALTGLLVLSLGVAVPVDARPAPPKQQAAKRGEAQRRALARQHAAQARRRVAARRKALAKANAALPVPPVVTEQPPLVTLPVEEPPAPLPVVTVPFPRTIGITQTEFSLALSRTTVGAGDVTVQVLNRGEDGHDLRIERLDGSLLWFVPELAPYENTLPTVVPMTPGTYRVLCTLTGHAELGMATQLTVAAG